MFSTRRVEKDKILKFWLSFFKSSWVLRQRPKSLCTECTHEPRTNQIVTARKKSERYSQEQIIRILTELKSGKTVDEICRVYGVAKDTLYNCKNKYGEMDLDELARLRETIMPLPPLEEMRCIVAKVDDLMHLCDQLSDEAAQVQAVSGRLFDSIVHHLFTTTQ